MTESSDERRAIIRIHTVWSRLAENRIPSRSQIDPTDFGADWSSCVFIKLDASGAEPRASFSDRGFDQKRIARPLAETLLGLAQRHIARVLGTGKPVGYGGTATHQDKDILYRIVLLPLSDDGAKIDALLAGMTYRDIPEATELRVSDIAWCKSPFDLDRSRDTSD